MSAFGFMVYSVSYFSFAVSYGVTLRVPLTDPVIRVPLRVPIRDQRTHELGFWALGVG